MSAVVTGRLERERIIRMLDAAVAADVAVVAEAESSNDILLAGSRPPPGEMSVCLVELQRSGRGRRGRRWFSPPGGSLALSAGWYLPEPGKSLAAFSLVVGVAVLRALRSVARVDAGVKWPNDIVLDERKLGGILVELQSDGNGTHVVAGVGINVSVPEELLPGLADWPRGAVDLTSMLPDWTPDRDQLAAALINELWGVFEVFRAEGFAAFADEWGRAHVLTGSHVTLRADAFEVEGIVHGVDRKGALLLERADGIERFLVGDVSVRPKS